MLVGLIQLTGYDAWLVDVDVLRVIGINAAKSEGLLNECPTTPLSRLGTQTLRGRVSSCIPSPSCLHLKPLGPGRGSRISASGSQLPEYSYPGKYKSMQVSR